MSSSRAEQIADLRAFQSADLQPLRARLAALDADILVAEAAVLHAANLLSASRGLVAQRGAPLPPPPPSTSSRARPKQLLWARRDGSRTRHPDAADPPPPPAVSANPVGVVYSAFKKRYEAPRQSFTGAAGAATVLLTAGASELRSIRKGDRVWLVYWLDRNDGLWRHFVRPPRAKGGWRVGVFATRSPNRPSPVGLSLAIVEDVDVEACSMRVSGVDVLDETPLLGWRKYEPAQEAWPHVKAGWIDELDKLQPLYYDQVDGYADLGSCDVVVEQGAEERIEFIDERSAIDVEEIVRESLKRVDVDNVGSVSTTDSDYEEEVEVKRSLAVGAFRVLYNVRRADRIIVVTDVISGMRRTICEEEAATDPEALLHLEFQDLFSEDVA